MQYEKINTNCTYINTNGSKHSETGPVRQNPVTNTNTMMNNCTFYWRKEKKMSKTWRTSRNQLIVRKSESQRICRSLVDKQSNFSTMSCRRGNFTGQPTMEYAFHSGIHISQLTKAYCLLANYVVWLSLAAQHYTNDAWRSVRHSNTIWPEVKMSTRGRSPSVNILTEDILY